MAAYAERRNQVRVVRNADEMSFAFVATLQSAADSSLRRTMKVVFVLPFLVAPSTAFQPAGQVWSRPVSTKVQAVAIPLPGVGQQASNSVVSPPAVPTKSNLAAEDQWIANLDYEGFGKEVTALGKQLQKEGGQADVNHLKKMVLWRNACALIGLATCWMAPNPLTVAALSTWTYASWTMIAHHTCHGGYNRVDAGGFNSRGFALGSVWNRAKDWLDWMHPEGTFGRTIPGEPRAKLSRDLTYLFIYSLEH